jgi:hypothetical protein
LSGSKKILATAGNPLSAIAVSTDTRFHRDTRVVRARVAQRRIRSPLTILKKRTRIL